MGSTATIRAGRAIASVMIRRYIFLPLLIFSFITFAFTLFIFRLALVDNIWWIILSLIFLLWSSIGFIAMILSFIFSNALQPRILLRKERRQILRFVKDFGVAYAASKGIKKSPLGLTFVLAWQYLKNRGKKNVAEIITQPIKDMKDLKNRFRSIVNLF